MSVANHKFTDSIGGRYCLNCGTTWRSMVERREEWVPGVAGFVCGSDRGLYSYEVVELDGEYEGEKLAVARAFGW